MSVFKSPYDTTAASGYKIDSIIEALQEAKIRGWLTGVSQQYGSPLLLVGGTGALDESVPTFYHPIAFTVDKEQFVAVDVRSTGSHSGQMGSFQPRSNARSEYESILMRGLLTEVWVNQGTEGLRNFSILPMGLFASWMAELIAKRLGLEVRDQFQVSILAAIFYQNLFWDKESVDTSDKTFLVSTISRGMNIKAAEVYDLVEMYPIIKSVGDFCTICQKANESPRLKQLNVGLLIQIVGGYWYGNNARETIAVALEHPPTWISLIYQAITDRGMRNSGLSKDLDRPGWKRQHDQFRRQVVSLAGGEF
jgi:hypothetical protein